MARKIKLPLDMGNDVKVRDIEELKENYNSEKVVESFLNGELLPWLRDRFYEEEAERVEALSDDKDSGNIAGRLAEIFGVHIESEVDVEEIAERNERLAKLRSITSDDEVLRNVDLVAFSQEDMDIVHESDVIYLCGDKFRIPYNVRNKRYIGVNEPLVEIRTEGTLDLESRGIVIEKCRFTEEMLSRLPEKVEYEVNDIPEAKGIFGEIGRYYSPRGAKGDLASLGQLDFVDNYNEEIKLIAACKEYENKTLELKYENVYIHLSTESLDVYRNVSMKFTNCVIHLGARDRQTKSVLVLHNNFNAMFSHCTFIFDKCGVYDNTFSTSRGEMSLFDTAYREARQSLNFKDCLFIHSNFLINSGLGSDSNLLSVLFKRCHFINCYNNVVDNRMGNTEVSVNGCAIQQDGRNMSFYDEKFIARLVGSDPIADVSSILFGTIRNVQGSKQTQGEKFIENLSNLVMFRKCRTARGNLIMQPKNLRYLKGTVGDDWEMYGVDLDSYDLTNTKIRPTVFPEGADIKDILYADPSDREALDRFFDSSYTESESQERKDSPAKSNPTSKSGGGFGFDLSEIEKMARASEVKSNSTPKLGGNFGFDLSEIEKMAKGIEANKRGW